MVTVHATNEAMLLIAYSEKQKRRQVVSTLPHYLSQPEVAETEASGRFADMLTTPRIVLVTLFTLTCEGALNTVHNATERNQILC